MPETTTTSTETIGVARAGGTTGIEGAIGGGE